MSMRRMMPFTIVLLLLFQTIAVNFVVPAEAASGRGGTNDDYTVKSITVGNSSAPASQWVQSDGTVVDYIFIDQTVEVTISVQRFGGSAIPDEAPVALDIVHPIGFVMESFNFFTNPLTGGQSYNHIVEWTPTAAHSVLNTTTNDLSGGLILRATVNFDDDDKNTNDQREKTLPVAIAANAMEDWSATLGPQFISGKYPADGGDAESTGSWQTDATTSANGAKHWRHSSAGSNYPSNAEATRLVHARYMSGNSCDTDAADTGLTLVYQAYICRIAFYSNEFVSSQFHLQAWGSMEAGDSVSMELWRGSGNINDPYESISWDIAQGNPSAAPGQWTNLSWDPQQTWLEIPNLGNPEVFLGGNSYTFSLLFTSDSSVAGEGMHVDDFVHFGVSRVTDYTLDLQCDNSLNGYTVAPNQMAPLYCTLTNNGYAPATVRLQTNVTNDSWMAPFPIIRMDIEGSSNHGTNVIIPPIGAGETIEFWSNLTVPAGADVQQRTWNLWLTDASSAQLGEKGRLTMDLAVSEQYGVALTSSVSLVAATIGPDESGTVSFRLQNTGNKDAAFNLATTFSENTGWLAVIENETGVIQQNPITLFKGQKVNLVLNITAPSEASPALGTESNPYVSFNLRATCPSCSTALYGNDVLVRNVEVPVLRTVQLETEEYTYSGPANGNAKSLYLTLLNLGNDDEQYDLSLVQSQWQLQASLLADQSPVLDAWDGESTIVVSLAMPIGLNPGIYTVTVKATSVDDPTVSDSIDLSIEILETAAVFVSDEETGQSYIPGDLPQTMSFEVRNDGNSDDSFAMSLDIPVGMVAQFTNLNANGETGALAVGTSYNVTVEFSFIDGTEGQLTLSVIATSTADSAISSSGQATYLVGSQNWLKIYAIAPVTINEEGETEVKVRIVNQYTTGQLVKMEVDDSESNKWLQVSIARLDRDFSLAVGEQKEITLTIDISETSLKNLNEETVTDNITVWARSETVSDAANANLELTLVRIDDQRTSGVEDAGSGLELESIALWAVFLIVIIGGVFVVLSILRTEEEDDEYAKWGEEGYEDSLSATYGAVAAAPSVPTSMPTSEPTASPSVVQNITYNITDSAISGDLSATAPAAAPPQEAGMPPLPEEGLPQGWTMEQWKHYGQQWLEQNGRA